MTKITPPISGSNAAAETRDQRLRDSFEMSPAVLWEINPFGRITFVNRTGFALTGYTEEDLANGLDAIKLVVPQQRARAAEAIARSLRGELVENQFYELLRKDGTGVPVLSRSRPIYEEEKIVGIRGVLIEVSGQQAAERERFELAAQVEHAQKLESLGVLASGIAHDLNNLIAAILSGVVELRKSITESVAQHEILDDIEASSWRAAELSRQMLTYSGKARLVRERSSLENAVSAIAPLLQSSVSKKARLVLELAEPCAAVSIDVAQMQQLIVNLVSNASESLGESTGTILLRTGQQNCSSKDIRRLGIYAPPQVGPYAFLSVGDTGVGLAPELLHKIFEPFWTTKYAGRGLGLAVVSGIVRAHKGAIEVQSAVGKGSEFKILIPLAEPGRKYTPAPLHWTTQIGDTVLLVDDEAVVLRTTQRLLKRAGYNVLTASNGKEALAIFAQHASQIACVLLDLSMPEMDGMETVLELKKIRAQVPVVLCTGYAERETAEQYTDAGFAGFLAKPFEHQELLSALRRVAPPSGRLDDF